MKPTSQVVYPPAVRIAVVGPTASGKSDLALDLIDVLGEGADSARPAAVVGADASQLYRGMDCGTAKLPPQERRGIVHHQIDVLSVRDEASVAAYQRHAMADAQRVEADGGRVVVVGGSGLYVRAVTDNFEFPGTHPLVRQRLEARVAEEGLAALWRELENTDPVSAARIQPTDSRRIVRALEVAEVTGRPFSASLPRYEDRVPTVHLAIRTDREALNMRIVRRTRRMFAHGLLEETRALCDHGLREGPTASRAIGYVQALAVIDGTMSREEACEATIVATRQLASRQLKWFRRDPRIHWLDLDLDDRGHCTPEAWERLVTRARECVVQREAGTCEPVLRSQTHTRQGF